MSETVKSPDGVTWIVRRFLLPAPLSASHLMGAAVSSSGSSSGNPLVALLFRFVLMLVVGLAILPFALLIRIVFRRWTVEAAAPGTTKRWKAKSWGAAGAGVKAISEALERGDSLQGPFPGLTLLT